MPDEPPAFSASELPAAIDAISAKDVAQPVKEEALNRVLTTAFQDLNSKGDFGEEQQKKWGQITKAAREKIAPGFLDKAKSYTVEPVVGMAKGLAKQAGTMAVAAYDFFGNADSEIGQGPGYEIAATYGEDFLNALARGGNSALELAKKGVDLLDKDAPARKLASGLDDLKKDIDDGKVPLNAGLPDWIKQKSTDLQQHQAAWNADYAEGGSPTDQSNTDFAKRNALTSPQNSELFTRYLVTRDPEAWKKFRSGMLKTSIHETIDKNQQLIDTSDGAKQFDSMFGPGASQNLRAASDPVMLAALVVPALRGVRAATLAADAVTARSLVLGTAKSAAIGAGLGAAGALEQDANASPGDVLSEAAKMAVGAGVFHAVPGSIPLLRKAPEEASAEPPVEPAAPLVQGAEPPPESQPAEPTAPPAPQITTAPLPPPPGTPPEAAPTEPQPIEPNAPPQRQEPQSNQPEHPGDGESRTPAEPSGRSSDANGPPVQEAIQGQEPPSDAGAPPGETEQPVLVPESPPPAGEPIPPRKRFSIRNRQKSPPGEPPKPGPQPVGEPDPQTQIRLAHADEAARAVAEGREPIKNVPQGTVKDWDALAQERVKNGEGAALVESLTQNPRVATPVEDYMMKHYAENLERTRDAANKTLSDPNATDAQKADASQKKEFADGEREKLALAANKAGSAWGAAGNARGRAKNRDEILSFPQMIADAMTAKGKAEGRSHSELSPEQRADVEKRYAAFEKNRLETEANTAARVEDNNAKLLAQAQAELAQAKADLAKAQNAPAKGQSKPRFTKRVVDSISVKADAARERLKARGVQFNAGIDPTLIPDYAIIMAEHIAKGVDAAAEMIGKFGAGIKDGLKEIEAAARRILSDESKVKTVAEIKQGLKDAQQTDPERTIGKNFANELAKAHIRDALEAGQKLSHDQLDVKVHQDLQEFVPDITLVEARDLRTGYGKRTFPSDDPVDVQLRDLNRQSQLVSSLERAEKKLAPMKSGPQRDKASAEVRDLQKKVNDAMARNGIEVRSPEAQLATRRESIKTRLTNEIEDLQRVIDGKQQARPPIPPPEYDTELQQLKDHRDNLKKAVDSMPDNIEASNKAKNDAALKAAQDAEAEWNRRAKELDFANKKKPTPERSQEVKDARKKADEARARYNDLKKAEQVNQPALYMADIASRVDAANKRIAHLEDKLNKGDLTVDTPEEKPSHPLLDERRAKVDELNKKLDDLRRKADAPAREVARLEKAVKDTQASVDDLQRRLSTGDLSKQPPAAKRPSNAALDSLRKQRDDLNKQLAKARSAAEAPARDAKRAARELEDAKKAVAALESKLAAGDLSKKAPTPRTVPSDLAAERAKLKDLNKQLARARQAAKAKPDPMAQRLKQFKDRTMAKIADLRLRRASENYVPSKRTPSQLKLDAEAEKLAVQKAKELQGWKEDKQAWELKNRTNFRKTMDFIVNFSRSMKLLHPSTIEKLGGAGIENIITRPIGTALAQIMRPFPVLRDIQRKATYEGRASLRSELKGLSGTLGSAKAVLQKAFKGKSDIDWLNEDRHYSEEFRNWAGQLHGAIKEPVRQGIYSRSLQLEVEDSMRHGVDPRGNELLMRALSSRAYENANMDIFMGDNLLTTAFRGAMTMLRNNKKAPGMGKFVADVSEILFPIINVPTNLVIRGLRLNPLIGLPEATIRIIDAARKGELANNAEKLSGADADIITRAFKYGLFGTALAAYAWNNPQNFGGFFVGEKRTGKKPQGLGFGDIKTPYGTLNHLLAHGPVGTWMNVVADSRREYDHFLKIHPHEDGQAGVSAAMWSMISPIQRVPFVDTVIHVFGDSKPWAQKGVELARGSFLPADTDIAQYFDRDAHGKPIKRKATTPLQELELGIPGLRKEVPRK